MPSYKDRIKSALTGAAKATKWPTVKPLVVRNTDRSVDGELRIVVPRGSDERDVIRDLQAIRIPKNTWFTIGTRYDESTIPDERKDKYLRWRGFREATQAYDTAYVRGESFLRAIDIANKMRKRYRRKASEVVMRLYYDPYLPVSRAHKHAGMMPERKGNVSVPKKAKAKKAKGKKGKGKKKLARKARKK